MGYDRQPCPNFPTSPSSPKRSTRRSADARSTAAEAPGPLAVRGTPAELQALVGQRVTSVRRTGKFLEIDLDRDRVVVNPMLTGRFQLAAPGTKLPTKTAVVLAFGNRGSTPAFEPAPWTVGAPWLPTDDARPEVRYRDPTQMGKVYLLPAGVDRPVPGLGTDEMGPEADDPDLTLEVWRERIRRAPGRAEEPACGTRRSSPGSAMPTATRCCTPRDCCRSASGRRSRRRRSMRCMTAMRTTLAHAIDVLRERVPPTFETQVRDFLAVHMKGGQPCPRCGTRITEVKAGGFVTSYCRGCQR